MKYFLILAFVLLSELNECKPVQINTQKQIDDLNLRRYISRLKKRIRKSPNKMRSQYKKFDNFSNHKQQGVVINGYRRFQNTDKTGKDDKDNKNQTDVKSKYKQFIEDANKLVDEDNQMIKDNLPAVKDSDLSEKKDPFAGEKKNTPLMKGSQVDVILFNKDSTIDQTKKFIPFKASVTNTHLILSDLNGVDKEYSFVFLEGMGLGKGIFFEPEGNYEKLMKRYKVKLAKQGADDPFEQIQRKVTDLFLQFINKQNELLAKKNSYEKVRPEEAPPNEEIEKCNDNKQLQLDKDEQQNDEEEAIPFNFCRIVNYVKRDQNPADPSNTFEIIYICSPKSTFFRKMVKRIKDDYVNNLIENKDFKKIPSLGDNMEYKVTLQSDDRELFHGKITLGKEVMEFEIDNFYTRYAMTYDIIKDCKIYKQFVIDPSFSQQCCIDYDTTTQNIQNSKFVQICKKFSTEMSSIEVQDYCYYFFAQMQQDLEKKCQKQQAFKMSQQKYLKGIIDSDPSGLSQQIAYKLQFIDLFGEELRKNEKILADFQKDKKKADKQINDLFMKNLNQCEKNKEKANKDLDKEIQKAKEDLNKSDEELKKELEKEKEEQDKVEKEEQEKDAAANKEKEEPPQETPECKKLKELEAKKKKEEEEKNKEENMQKKLNKKKEQELAKKKKKKEQELEKMAKDEQLQKSVKKVKKQKQGLIDQLSSWI